jgi:hypothetical protein
MRRTRSTSRERGAVMVESIVVVVMLTIGLASVWFVHNAAFYQVEAMRFSKNEAWAKAMPGCGASTMTNPDSADGFADLPDDGSTAPTPSSDPSEAKKSYDGTGPRGNTFTMTSATRVSCNETLQGGLGGVLGWALQTIADGNFFF